MAVSLMGCGGTQQAAETTKALETTAAGEAATETGGAGATELTTSGQNYILATQGVDTPVVLSLIHISEPTRQEANSYAVFCLKKKKKT